MVRVVGVHAYLGVDVALPTGAVVVRGGHVVGMRIRIPLGGQERVEDRSSAMLVILHVGEAGRRVRVLLPPFETHKQIVLYGDGCVSNEIPARSLMFALEGGGHAKLVEQCRLHPPAAFVGHLW